MGIEGGKYRNDHDTRKAESGDRSASTASNQEFSSPLPRHFLYSRPVIRTYSLQPAVSSLPMAGFKTHITTSSVLGVGYAALGYHWGLPVESCAIAGGLCGIGGMLPDIDSDTGVPFRESMCFAAAIVPMMLLSRFRQLGWNHDHIVIATAGMYLFVRFGVAHMLARHTVHRGMFHSIPAALIFTGIAFLLGNAENLQLRYFKASGVFVGVMSHLMLDELYSIEWASGRWRFKKSLGTAIKLWGQSAKANFVAYFALGLIAMTILGEPMVTEQYGEFLPVALRPEQWAGEVVAYDPFGTGPVAQQFDANGQPIYPSVEPPKVDRNIYDTARRLWRQLQE